MSKHKQPNTDTNKTIFLFFAPKKAKTRATIDTTHKIISNEKTVQ